MRHLLLCLLPGFSLPLPVHDLIFSLPWKGSHSRLTEWSSHLVSRATSLLSDHWKDLRHDESDGSNSQEDIERWKTSCSGGYQEECFEQQIQKNISVHMYLTKTILGSGSPSRTSLVQALLLHEVNAPSPFMFLPFLVQQVMFNQFLFLVSAGYLQPVSSGSFWRNGSNFSTCMRSNKRDQHVNKKLQHPSPLN